MTLPRKGSRTIEIDGTTYRWKPSPMRTEPPMMSLVAHEDTLPANSTLDVAFWESHCSILTPETVGLLIRGALGAGWKPKSRGTFKIGPDHRDPTVWRWVSTPPSRRREAIVPTASWRSPRLRSSAWTGHGGFPSPSCGDTSQGRSGPSRTGS